MAGVCRRRSIVKRSVRASLEVESPSGRRLEVSPASSHLVSRMKQLEVASRRQLCSLLLNSLVYAPTFHSLMRMLRLRGM